MKNPEKHIVIPRCSSIRHGRTTSSLAAILVASLLCGCSCIRNEQSIWSGTQSEREVNGLAIISDAHSSDSDATAALLALDTTKDTKAFWLEVLSCNHFSRGRRYLAACALIDRHVEFPCPMHSLSDVQGVKVFDGNCVAQRILYYKGFLPVDTSKGAATYELVNNKFGTDAPVLYIVTSWILEDEEVIQMLNKGYSRHNAVAIVDAGLALAPAYRMLQDSKDR